MKKLIGAVSIVITILASSAIFVYFSLSLASPSLTNNVKPHVNVWEIEFVDDYLTYKEEVLDYWNGSPASFEKVAASNPHSTKYCRNVCPHLQLVK